MMGSGFVLLVILQKEATRGSGQGLKVVAAIVRDAMVRIQNATLAQIHRHQQKMGLMLLLIQRSGSLAGTIM